jgi:hypothetical protein
MRALGDHRLIFVSVFHVTKAVISIMAFCEMEHPEYLFGPVR